MSSSIIKADDFTRNSQENHEDHKGHKDHEDLDQEDHEDTMTARLEILLPGERTLSSVPVKNAPRKDKENVISNLEDYCTIDRDLNFRE